MEGRENFQNFLRFADKICNLDQESLFRFSQVGGCPPPNPDTVRQLLTSHVVMSSVERFLTNSNPVDGSNLPQDFKSLLHLREVRNLLRAISLEQFGFLRCSLGDQSNHLNDGERGSLFRELCSYLEEEDVDVLQNLCRSPISFGNAELMQYLKLNDRPLLLPMVRHLLTMPDYELESFQRTLPHFSLLQKNLLIRILSLDDSFFFQVQVVSCAIRDHFASSSPSLPFSPSPSPSPSLSPSSPTSFSSLNPSLPPSVPSFSTSSSSSSQSIPRAGVKRSFTEPTQNTMSGPQSTRFYLTLHEFPDVSQSIVSRKPLPRPKPSVLLHGDDTGVQGHLYAVPILTDFETNEPKEGELLGDSPELVVHGCPTIFHQLKIKRTSLQLASAVPPIRPSIRFELRRYHGDPKRGAPYDILHWVKSPLLDIVSHTILKRVKRTPASSSSSSSSLSSLNQQNSRKRPKPTQTVPRQFPPQQHIPSPHIQPISVVPQQSPHLQQQHPQPTIIPQQQQHQQTHLPQQTTMTFPIIEEVIPTETSYRGEGRVAIIGHNFLSESVIPAQIRIRFGLDSQVVPEILSTNTLICYAPRHPVGIVPVSVTLDDGHTWSEPVSFSFLGEGGKMEQASVGGDNMIPFDLDSLIAGACDELHQFYYRG